MSDRAVNEATVETGDPDEVIRQIDRWCSSRSWDALAELERLSRLAVERGKQLWGAAAHAQYRLVLEAPPDHAVAALQLGDGRLGVGPLTEVLASRLGWVDVQGALEAGPTRSLVAHERVTRGEDLGAVLDIGPSIYDLPLTLQPWEPHYPVATYTAYAVQAPSVPWPELHPVTLAPEMPATVAHPGVGALEELVRVWTRDSSGRARAIAVEGPAVDAIRALGPVNASVASCSAADALAHMAWAAASSAAHGRRRGAAAGRSDAMWAAATIAEIDGDLGDQAVLDDLGDALGEQNWYCWNSGEPVTGWQLQLAVNDPGTGLSFAISAVDQR